MALGAVCVANYYADQADARNADEDAREAERIAAAAAVMSRISRMKMGRLIGLTEHTSTPRPHTGYSPDVTGDTARQPN